MASQFRVLIVEDEPLVADVLQATLDSEYHVSSVNTVKEALAFLHTSHADVVLLDTVLPDGRGNEVASFAEKLGVAVIHMSGYPEEMGDMQRSGRPHLFKPFKAEVLLSTIRDSLASHE